MTTWTTNATGNDNRDASASNVGTLVTDIEDPTITSISIAFTTSGGGTAACYIQEEDGTITQFGSNYTNNSVETHTFTDSKTVSGTNFIVYIYSSTGTTLGVSIQYQGATVLNGQEKSYFPKNVSPTYASWTTPSCGSGYCGMVLSFEYTGAVPTADVLLPPQPAMVRL